MGSFILTANHYLTETEETESAHVCKLGDRLPVKIAVEGHTAVPCCRECDWIMNEEPDSPRPKGYFLFRCPVCGYRIGIAVVAIAASKSIHLMESLPIRSVLGAEKQVEGSGN